MLSNHTSLAHPPFSSYNPFNNPIYPLPTPCSYVNQQIPIPALLSASVAGSLQGVGLPTAFCGQSSATISNSVGIDYGSSDLHEPRNLAGGDYQIATSSGIDSSVLQALQDQPATPATPAIAVDPQPQSDSEALTTPTASGSSSPATTQPLQFEKSTVKLTPRRRRQPNQQLICPSCPKVFTRPGDLK